MTAKPAHAVKLRCLQKKLFLYNTKPAGYSTLFVPEMLTINFEISPVKKSYN